MFFAVVCMILVALSTAAFTYLIKFVFDEVFKSSANQEMLFFATALFAVFVIKAVASYGESVLLAYVGQRMISDIQSNLFKHLMTLDISFFHKSSSGDILSRFTNDVQLMRTSFSTVAVSIGKDLVTLIALVGVMFYREPILALIAFTVFPVAIFPIFKLGRKMGKATYKAQNQMGDLTSRLSQVMQSIRVVKAYHSEEVEQKFVDQSIFVLFKMIYKTARIRSSAHPIVEIISGMAIISVICYGGWQVSQNLRTTGDFISFIFALLLVYEPLKRLSHLNTNLQEGIASVRRIYEIFDIKPKILNCMNPKKLGTVKTDIVFKAITFQYDGHSQLFKNLTFHIPIGKSVAFVGPSGSGKSTIINLIPRFYDVQEGQILINSEDIKAFDIESLRSKIALVSQEISLFDRSIYDNIAYGAINTTKEQVIEAAKKALAHDFIMKLPHQYDTFVGENGVILSGGQRQRIAIARAMVKNAPILLLDEATSALDSESEKQVQDSLNNLMFNRTTVIVAHRLSTIVDCDIIYVLNNGQIVELGTHKELLLKKGQYADLWYAQIERV
ncbi:MAG: ABC transporter ATP-binding protein [Proteobacteria bacterium]|nr:ABC transporter ATP-binding protein [Pseudomonadota bacterium]